MIMIRKPNAHLTLIVLSFAISTTAQEQSACQVSTFNISAYDQGFQYSARFSQIAPCTTSQISVSNLYLSGACLNSNCTLTAGPLTCPVRASDYYNLSSLVRTDDLTYQFASDIVCRPASNTSYFYTSTTCAQFDPSWIQLNPISDPADCYTYKAYNYGAAIGIIVAVIVFLAVLIGGWIFWYRRRSRQGVYESQHDMQMQPYSDGAAGQAYSSQGYSSSSLPAQQTSSAERMHPGYPAAGARPGGGGQGPPVYPPWTGGGFKPTGGSTPR